MKSKKPKEEKRAEVAEKQPENDPKSTRSFVKRCFLSLFSLRLLIPTLAAKVKVGAAADLSS